MNRRRKIKVLYISIVVILLTTHFVTGFHSDSIRNKSMYQSEYVSSEQIKQIASIQNGNQSYGVYTTNYSKIIKGCDKPTLLQGSPTAYTVQKNQAGSNIQITSSILNESHPNIGFDTNHNPIVLFDTGKENGDNDICILQSNNGGQTWDANSVYIWDLITLNDLHDKNPEICFFDNGTSATGTHDTKEEIPFTFSHQYYDINNPSTWKMYAFDETTHSSYVKESTSTTMNNNIILIASIVDIYFGADYIDNALKVWYNNNSGVGTWYYIFISHGHNQQYSNLCSDNDKSIYICWQDQNTSYRFHNNSYIIYFHDDLERYPTLGYNLTYFGSNTSNLTNPDICVNGSEAHIVFMNDGDGNEDIYYYNSESIRVIADSPEDEVYPQIELYDDKLVCLFLKNDNMFMTYSDDEGNTWSNPIRINNKKNSVLTDEKNYDIKELFTVWSDTRNNNTDIFFDQITSDPIYIIESVQDGFFVSARIKNVALIPAQNVTWTITIDSPFLLHGQETMGTISLLCGEAKKIQSDFLFGFGPVTVSIQISQYSKSQQGFIIGPYLLFNSAAPLFGG